MDTSTLPRPWPAPSAPWALAMTWHDLAFLHWPLPIAALRPLVPAAVTLDTFEGAAWLGIVPFHMSDVHPHYLPPLPPTAAFPELNVRTYVTIGGRPGVYFFSLDAASALAVRAARLGFQLPYYDARMAATRDGATIVYRSRRTHRAVPPARFAARYRATGPARPAAPGSLEDWLTARYCLYTANRRGGVRRVEIAHAPWSLQPGEVALEENTMAAPLRVALPDTPPLTHVAARLEVVAWLPQPVAGAHR